MSAVVDASDRKGADKEFWSVLHAKAPVVMATAQAACALAQQVQNAIQAYQDLWDRALAHTTLATMDVDLLPLLVVRPGNKPAQLPLGPDGFTVGLSKKMRCEWLYPKCSDDGDGVELRAAVDLWCVKAKPVLRALFNLQLLDIGHDDVVAEMINALTEDGWMHQEDMECVVLTMLLAAKEAVEQDHLQMEQDFWKTVWTEVPDYFSSALHRFPLLATFHETVVVPHQKKKSKKKDKAAPQSE